MKNSVFVIVCKLTQCLIMLKYRKTSHKSTTLRNKAKQVRPLFGRGMLTVPYSLSPELELYSATTAPPTIATHTVSSLITADSHLHEYHSE